MARAQAILDTLRNQLDLTDFKKLNWEGTFDEYINIVLDTPGVTRTAYQRVYDMILSHGVEDVYENKEKLTRFKFFTEFASRHADGIYGLDRPLMQLVNTFKSAALGYGTERRVILLHGPVGSAKSTIARLLKRGIEEYSRTDKGMLFSFKWKNDDGTWTKDPMHGEPLQLVPEEHRVQMLSMLNEQCTKPHPYEIRIKGDLCPYSRFEYRVRLAKYNGDFLEMLRNEVKIYRLVLSEKDRIGIGTFQPKDEKNQDSTELTGDINYRKIAEYGSDSDPRCVVGSTMLSTGEGLVNSGSLLPFLPEADTFVPRPMAVSSIAPKPVAHSDSVYYAGTHPVHTIRTQHGYKLSASANHMVLTLTEDGEPAWKQMRLVQPGDFVAMGRGVHTWPSANASVKPFAVVTHLTPELARFIGLCLGQASVPNDLETQLPELRETLRDAATRAAFTQWLTTNFGIGVQEPVIPEAVLHSTRDCVMACLSGLWETGDSLRQRTFATSSAPLARQVHLLMLANGIVASLVQTTSNWEVRVDGANFKRLVELLPQLRDQLPTQALSANDEMLPYLKPRLRGIYQRASNREQLASFSSELLDETHANVSYRTATEFLSRVEPAGDDRADVAALRQLVDDHHAWLPVESIEQEAPAALFDLSVKTTHAFWADGFICHNCFNFDGELNIANRGIIEFIEVLKLDVAFLYDLLGASQEHKIKPKKFAQTDIDEVILGHSVAGDTPIPYRDAGRAGWTTLAGLYAQFVDNTETLEVLAHDFATGRTDWTPVRSLFRHPFTGKMLTTTQKWGAIETTPNHSIYSRDGHAYFPEQRQEVMAVRQLHGMFADPLATIDLLEGMPEFVRDEVTVAAQTGSKATRAKAVRGVYDPIVDVVPLKDLLTLFTHYVTDGPIDDAAVTRLGFTAREFAAICTHHCGQPHDTKRLPDFLFRLPTAYVKHLFDAFQRSTNNSVFETASPILAAQVGTLATLTGSDYRVDAVAGTSTYRIRLGADTIDEPQFEAGLHERPVTDEWVYDIECVGLHNFVCGVGNVVAHNTNEPEYRRLQNNEFMEALRDRTVKIDIPYVTRLRDEVRIYEKDFNVDKVKGKHIAPHTIEVAAMWAVLTRLSPPKHASLTMLQKLKLYNGKTLPGFTEDNVIELKREANHEGMAGISPRYIQDKISNALVVHPDEDNINPFMVMKELEEGLRHHALLKDEEQYRHFKELLSTVREEYEDVVKNEVQRAIAADEEALMRLCGNYIDNVKAYTQREKVRNRYTGNYDEPDERLMRSVEEKIDIPEGRKDDFRREIMNYIGALAIDGKKFDYKTNERLQKALELKLFEDQKDTIKLTSLVSNVVDRATQEKIDVVKSRLIRNYGYNESSATDVLNFVASIFARGQTKK